MLLFLTNFFGTTVYQNDTNSFSYKENEQLDDKLKAEDIAKQINVYLEKGYIFENKVDTKLFMGKENIPKLKLFLNKSLIKIKFILMMKIGV